MNRLLFHFSLYIAQDNQHALWVFFEAPACEKLASQYPHFNFSTIDLLISSIRHLSRKTLNLFLNMKVGRCKGSAAPAGTRTQPTPEPSEDLDALDCAPRHPEGALREDAPRDRPPRTRRIKTPAAGHSGDGRDTSGFRSAECYSAASSVASSASGAASTSASASASAASSSAVTPTSTTTSARISR